MSTAKDERFASLKFHDGPHMDLHTHLICCAANPRVAGGRKLRPTRRRRKMGRAELRLIIKGKSRPKHGGRGRKVGLKGGKKQKTNTLSALLRKLGK